LDYSFPTFILKNFKLTEKVKEELHRISIHFPNFLFSSLYIMCIHVFTYAYFGLKYVFADAYFGLKYVFADAYFWLNYLKASGSLCNTLPLNT
jgi:hypothetical protein